MNFIIKKIFTRNNNPKKTIDIASSFNEKTDIGDNKKETINGASILTKKTYKYQDDGNNIYIQEWLSIENIVTKDFEQKYLEPEINDECENISIDACNTEKCDIYKSVSNNSETCVNKKRIKKFQSTTISPIIIGKNGLKYKLMDTVIFENKIDNDITIYYYVFLSITTNTIYILFPTGTVFNNEIFSYLGLKDFLINLIEKINDNNKNNTTKYILCGHSMGCVLALYTGIIIYEEYNSLFSNITVIGSAPFKFHNNNDIFKKFSNLENVKIFVYGYKNNQLFVDCFVNKGDYKYSYSPLTYFIDYSDDNENEYNINYINNNLCEYSHSWENYYNILSKIYKYNQTDNNEGGGQHANRAEKIQKRKQDETAENPFVAIVVIKELFYYKKNKIILERIPLA